MRLCTLKRSAEFHRLRGGLRWSGPGFLIEGKARVPVAAHQVVVEQAGSASTAQVHQPDGQPVTRSAKRPLATAPIVFEGPRFGFTVTRKIGGAVERNRIRRRLREALRIMDTALMRPNFDYVVVARKSAAERSFADLERDFRNAFAQIHRHPGASERRRG